MGRSLQINSPITKIVRNTNTYSLSSGQTSNIHYAYTPYTAPAGRMAKVNFSSSYVKSDRHDANLSQWNVAYFVNYSASTEFKQFGWHHNTWSNNSANENVIFISAPWNFSNTPNNVTSGYTSERWQDNNNNMPVPRDLTAAQNGQLPNNWGSGGNNYQEVNSYNQPYETAWMPLVRMHKNVIVPSGASVRVLTTMQTNGGTHNIVNEFVFEVEEMDEIT